MNGILCISVTICLLGSVFDGSDAYSFHMPLEDKVLRECIMKDLSCPADGSIDFRRNRIVYKIIQSLDLPDRCSCDLSEKLCLRGCLYNYMVKYAVLYVAWSALAFGRDVEAIKQTTVQYVETNYKPCLMEDKGCKAMFGEMKPTVLTGMLARFRMLVDMPADCECDIETDTCARKCYYSVVKKYLENGIGKTN